MKLTCSREQILVLLAKLISDVGRSQCVFQSADAQTVDLIAVAASLSPFDNWLLIAPDAAGALPIDELRGFYPAAMRVQGIE